MNAEGFDTFLQARDFYEGRLRDGRAVRPRLIVVHSTETASGPGVAEAIQRVWHGDDGRKASTHGVADDDSVAGCVHLDDTAFGAAGANSDGLHMEHCARATWDAADWRAHEPMMRRSARTTALWSAKFTIPRRRLTVAQVRDRVTRGFTDHATVQRAFPSSGHWDPGPWFPWDHYLDLANYFATRRGTAPSPAGPPAWPLPAGHWFGRPDPDARNHSGYFSRNDRLRLTRFQVQMRHRGWTVNTDGLFTEQTERVVRAFDREKGVETGVPGKVGARMWRAAWEKPVTGVRAA